jgi:hypothetical protein
MAQQTRLTPHKVNLAKSTNYRLNIHMLPNVQFWLTTCNLPTYSVNEVIIPDMVHGHRYKPTNTSTIAPMTVTFLVDEDYQNYMEILDLMFKAAGPDLSKRFKEGEATGSDGSLHILSNNKNISDVVFTFHNLFPTILGELQMTNESPDPLLTDLTLQYDYMTYQSGLPL